jgi:Fe-S oxidoreductase
MMLAEQNVETLNGYKQGGKKKIITTCPHCFNTLLNEYPDFGASTRWCTTPTSCSGSSPREAQARRSA